VKQWLITHVYVGDIVIFFFFCLFLAPEMKEEFAGLGLYTKHLR